MQRPISILVVDDSPVTRENVTRLCQFDPELQVVGEAANGKEALLQARRLQPDVILMDINMPEVDGIAATESISRENLGTSIIMMSVQGEQEYLRQAMLAGAREYLTKPFSGDELANTIKRVYHKRFKPTAGQIFTVFSAKGGVGKTTLATNLAALLAAEGEKVALVDLDLQFGDAALMLDLLPKRTIADLVVEQELTPEVVEDYLLTHGSGVQLLAAPSRPEQAELVSSQQVTTILQALQKSFEYIVVDTAPFFHSTVLAALDLADRIILLTALDLPTFKNSRLSLETMRTLKYPLEKIVIVVNRYATDIGISVTELEAGLGCQVQGRLPSDGRVVVDAINKGQPFVLTEPKAPVTQGVRSLTQLLKGDLRQQPPKQPFFSRLVAGLRQVN